MWILKICKKKKRNRISTFVCYKRQETWESQIIVVPKYDQNFGALLSSDSCTLHLKKYFFFFNFQWKILSMSSLRGVHLISGIAQYASCHCRCIVIAIRILICNVNCQVDFYCKSFTIIELLQNIILIRCYCVFSSRNVMFSSAS